jgi:hypothetical protein
MTTPVTLVTRAPISTVTRACASDSSYTSEKGAPVTSVTKTPAPLVISPYESQSGAKNRFADKGSERMGRNVECSSGLYEKASNLGGA